MKALAADLTHLFGAALERHRAGDLQAAGRMYRQILASHPEQPDALNLLGVITLEDGRYEEAAGLLRRAVAASGEVPEFHCHLGNALQGAGDFAAAAAAYRRAISLRPDYVEAHSSLGFALARVGCLAEAISCYHAALASAPDYFFALNNLGDALSAQGDPAAAAQAYARAVAVAPGAAEVHAKLGALLRELGRPAEALEALSWAVDAGNEQPAVYRMLGSLWRFSRPLRYDPELDRRLLGFFNSAGVDHGDAAEFAGALLELKYAPRLDAGEQPDCAFVVNTLLADELAGALLTRSVNGDGRLELLLTSARRWLLLGDDAASEALMQAASVLARQSFINEYVFAVGEDEYPRLDAIEKKIDSHPHWSSALGADIQYALLLFAMYAPLSQLRIAARLAGVPMARWHECLRPLVKRSLLDAQEERALEAEIPALGRIENAVSREVKRQYEENPYPRWLTPAYRDPGKLHGILTAMFPAFEPPEILEGAIRVLVVGCGTGYHPISIALRYENATVVATDISRRSLAYAARMARELKITNLRFVENDLLNLAELDGEFHVIECVGVLHHTQSISDGVHALLGKLHADGLLKIGLYSATARAPVVLARRRIAELGLTASAEDIRRFRQMALRAGEDDAIAQILQFGDFYTLSNCRDLLFHVHEENVTIAALRKLLEGTGLRFIGFESADASLHEDYRRRFPGDEAMDDLLRWQILEEENPGVFAGLYQCWCERVR